MYKNQCWFSFFRLIAFFNILPNHISTLQSLYFLSLFILAFGLVYSFLNYLTSYSAISFATNFLKAHMSSTLKRPMAIIWPTQLDQRYIAEGYLCWFLQCHQSQYSHFNMLNPLINWRTFFKMHVWYLDWIFNILSIIFRKSI